MTTRETTFRESDHPGIVFPGNVLSGKMTIRETTFRETSFREKNHPGKLTIRETTVYPGDKPNCCSLHAADVHKRQTFVRCLLSYTLHSDCYTRLHVVILRTFNSNKAVNVFMFVCESHLRCPASESSPSGSQIFSSCFSTIKLSSALGEFSLCSLK